MTALSNSEESTFTSVATFACRVVVDTTGVVAFSVVVSVVAEAAVVALATGAATGCVAALSVVVAAGAVVVSAVEVAPTGAVVSAFAVVVAVELLAASVEAAFDCTARLVSEASATGVDVVGFVAVTSSAATPW